MHIYVFGLFPQLLSFPLIDPLTLLSEFLSYFHVAVAVFVADVVHVRVARMSMSVGVVNCSPICPSVATLLKTCLLLLQLPLTSSDVLRESKGGSQAPSPLCAGMSMDPDL